MKSLYKNILVVRTDRIGDLVLTLPLAGLIKKNYPGSKVSFLVRDYTREIINGHQFVDEVMILEERGGRILFFKNLQRIKSAKFDVCLIVYPKFIVSLILFFSGIKFRIGTGYRWYSFLFNKKVFEHRKYAEKHELEFNIGMLSQIGVNEEVDENNIEYHIPVNRDSLKKTDEILEKNNINKSKPIIIVHPGSAGSSIDLPPEKFSQLVNRLADDNYQIILTGSEEEIDICNEIGHSGKVLNLAGKFSLEELTSLISRADLFISNSTGPIHIAAALGVFTVGFYPRIISCSKERWAPYTKKRLIYEPESGCSNCTRKKCEKTNCMSSVDTGRVYRDIKGILMQNKVESK